MDTVESKEEFLRRIAAAVESIRQRYDLALPISEAEWQAGWEGFGRENAVPPTRPQSPPPAR